MSPAVHHTDPDNTPPGHSVSFSFNNAPFQPPRPPVAVVCVGPGEDRNLSGLKLTFGSVHRAQQPEQEQPEVEQPEVEQCAG